MVPMVVIPRTGHFGGEGGALILYRKPITGPVLGRSAGYIHSRRYMIASRAVGRAPGRLPSLGRPDRTLEARLNPLLPGFFLLLSGSEGEKSLAFQLPSAFRMVFIGSAVNGSHSTAVFGCRTIRHKTCWIVHSKKPVFSACKHRKKQARLAMTFMSYRKNPVNQGMRVFLQP